jgi:hypothetical protein
VRNLVGEGESDDVPVRLGTVPAIPTPKRSDISEADCEMF